MSLNASLPLSQVVHDAAPANVLLNALISHQLELAEPVMDCALPAVRSA